MNQYNFSIKINDKGGVPYRDYTPTTFRKLFLESKTGANFELVSLIEGLTFLGYFIYCNVSKQPEKYNKILKNPKEGSFASVIDYLFKAKVISKNLKLQLHKYRKERNSVVHNWLNFKEPLNSDFKNHSYDEALGQLFMCGMETIGMLHKEIVPSKKTWIDYVKRFSGNEPPENSKKTKA
ncbi:hypothetical protein C4578_03590 [Candidatus Microgenomates bacterium]|jgi:hypothetical protein|nr:MAG: hypothetical protein C4578_03590 [Candidatus Microgenomates bacterium]